MSGTPFRGREGKRGEGWEGQGEAGRVERGVGGRRGG